jgi:hypothetical protein
VAQCHSKREIIEVSNRIYDMYNVLTALVNVDNNACKCLLWMI